MIEYGSSIKKFVSVLGEPQESIQHPLEPRGVGNYLNIDNLIIAIESYALQGINASLASFQYI